ncbi:MAG: aminotransferase class V-fold PLP-dependent enzyme [Planctomycetota bacterium]
MSAAPPLPALEPPPRLGERALFPDLRPRAYLAHAAIGIPPLPARAAARACADDVAARGAEAFPTWVAQRDRLRGALARFLGAEGPETIALVAGTTRGVIDIARSIAWRPGERVLLFEGEFPANVTPWQAVARDHALEPVFAPLEGFDDGSGLGLERLEQELRRGVRLVALSAVEFQTGLALPLQEIGALCRAHGAELFVDAIQAAGALPLDVARDGVDYLVSGAHKWLGGLEGAGFAYVAPARARALVPRVAGWLSHQDALRFLFEGAGHLRYDRNFKQDASLLEPGVGNACGFAALEAALAVLEALGAREIAAHHQAYHDALEPGLLELGCRSVRAADPAARSGILACLPPPGHELAAVAAGLAARGVSVSTPDGYLRFAPHWSNALAEVEHVLAAFAQVVGASAP